jgi:hypothetical protein
VTRKPQTNIDPRVTPQVAEKHVTHYVDHVTEVEPIREMPLKYIGTRGMSEHPVKNPKRLPNHTQSDIEILNPVYKRVVTVTVPFPGKALGRQPFRYVNVLKGEAVQQRSLPLMESQSQVPSDGCESIEACQRYQKGQRH